MPLTRKDFERYRLHIRFAKERHEKKREQTILTWAGLEVLLDRLDALEKVKEYAVHDDECILSFWSAGEPRSDGSYWANIKGKWYQQRPVDKTPKCDCGLAEALRACPALEDGEK